MNDVIYRKIDAANKLAGIATPIVIGLIGIVLTYQKNSADNEKASLDRVTATIQHISSSEPRERLFALKLVNYLISKRKYPQELQSAVLELSVSDKNPEVAAAATDTANRAAAAYPDLRPEVNRTESMLPARVYFHIQSEDQRQQAQQLADSLSTVDLKVPGIQLVKAGPDRNELRYFRSEDGAEAQRIANTMADMKWSVSVIDLTKRYQGNTVLRPRHFELWEAPSKRN